jgi:hypothetical protein
VPGRGHIMCLDELSGSDGRSRGHVDPWEHPYTLAPLASSTSGRWNPSPAVPSAGRLTPMSSRGLRRARHSSEASWVTSSSACWGQTRHRSVLGSPPTTSPTSPSRPSETDRWAGGVHGVVHRNVPLWTARPLGRPGDGLC